MTIKKITCIEIVTILYIILFLYTAISKLIDFDTFKEQIATSPLLTPIAKYIAAMLPFVEFFAVLLLINPRWRLKGFYTSLILMIGFTSYIIAILLFNDQLPCSCGGVLQEMSWKQHIFFNSFFIVLATIAIVLEKQIRRDRSANVSFAH